MGYISKQYIKNYVCRYNKEVGVPYYSYLDFKGLHQDKGTFVNSKKVDIHYFFYYYDNYKKDKIILFCHGLGPGHTAYLAEIEALAKHGYRVLTLDFTGCDASGGEYLGAMTNPTVDAIDLLNHLSLKEEVVVVGHSMGGYTALNLVHMRDDIHKAVIMSGFLSISLMIHSAVRQKFIANRICKYERKTNKEIYDLDNVAYLKTTKDQIFFIQSDDDQMVPYEIGLKIVESIDKPNIKTLKVINRKHNPNYTDEAINYMNEVFGQYYALINEKKIKTDEDSIAYFKDVSLAKLVEQDPDIIKQIVDFIA